MWRITNINLTGASAPSFLETDMKKFAVHNTGDWIRDNYGVTRSPARVDEFDTLDEVSAFDRQQFEWMLSQGEVVISMGNTVYQIRRV